MFIQVATPAQAVEAATQAVLNLGEVVAPRGQQTRELMNVTLRVDDPYIVPIMLKGRRLGAFTTAVEALQLVGMTSVPEFVASGAPTFRPYMDGGIFHGAYGMRIYGRLDALVNQLQKDPDTRQAVLTIFDSRQDLGAEVHDVPCTLSLQYFVRDGALCARTSMRSNDAWLGLPYDLTQFIALQGAVAKALDLPMGWYSHSVGSLHLYERDVASAEKVEANNIVSTGTYAWNRTTGLWGPGSIAEISSRARSILNGTMSPLEYRTSFESYLYDAITTRRTEMAV